VSLTSDGSRRVLPALPWQPRHCPSALTPCLTHVPSQQLLSPPPHSTPALVHAAAPCVRPARSPPLHTFQPAPRTLFRPAAAQRRRRRGVRRAAAPPAAEPADLDTLPVSRLTCAGRRRPPPPLPPPAGQPHDLTTFVSATGPGAQPQILKNATQKKVASRSIDREEKGGKGGGGGMTDVEGCASCASACVVLGGSCTAAGRLLAAGRRPRAADRLCMSCRGMHPHNHPRLAPSLDAGCRAAERGGLGQPNCGARWGRCARGSSPACGRGRRRRRRGRQPVDRVPGAGGAAAAGARGQLLGAALRCAACIGSGPGPAARTALPCLPQPAERFASTPSRASLPPRTVCAPGRGGEEGCGRGGA
jgi:hypothetical protein